MTKLITPVGEMQRSAAKSMTRLADKVQGDHDGMMTHKHLRDAARTLMRGNTDGAKRHLDAATHEMQPQTLYRHGHLTDDVHAAAKQNMGEINRHRLLVQDIEDVRARNADALQRMRDQRDADQNQRNINRLRDQSAGGLPMSDAPKPSSSVNAPSALNIGKPSGTASGPAEPPPTTSQNHANITLSAETARLAVTPAPRGKPGGPGLYDVKGLGHTPYLQQIVKALIEKRGMDPGKAYAIARASIRKWMAKSKHPEVKAAAGAAEAGELAKQAQAHSHAVQIAEFREIWELACSMATVIELTGTAAGSAKDQRSAITGQYTSGSTGSPSGKPGAKPGGKSVKGHPHHQNQQSGKAHEKAQLQEKIGDERAQLRGLIAQIRAINRNPQGSSGSSTSSTSKTGAAAATAAAATPAAAAAAAAKPGSSTAAASKPSQPARPLSPAQMARRAALRARIQALRNEIRQQEKQMRGL